MGPQESKIVRQKIASEKITRVHGVIGVGSTDTKGPWIAGSMENWNLSRDVFFILIVIPPIVAILRQVLRIKSIAQ